MTSLKKYFKRGGPGIMGPETTQIFKTVTSSVHTKKKERVEIGDVTYNFRDPTCDRFDDSLLSFPKSTNPSIKVEYQNHRVWTGAKHQQGGLQATNPYKINKAVRYPQYTLEDILPLSRQKRPWTAVTTNPGAKDSGVGLPQDSFDRSTVNSIIAVQPMEVYVQTNPSRNITTGLSERDKVIMREKMSVEAYSNPSQHIEHGGVETLQTKQILDKDLLYASAYSNPSFFPAELQGPENLPQEIIDRMYHSVSSNPTKLSDLEPFLSVDPYSLVKEKEIIQMITNPSYYKIDSKDYGDQGEVTLDHKQLKQPVQSNPTGYKDFEIYRDLIREESPYGMIIRPAIRINASMLADTSDAERGEHIDKIKSKLLKQLAGEIQPTAKFIVYDSSVHDYMEVKGNVHDKLKLAAQAAVSAPLYVPTMSDRPPVVLRDYQWKIIQSTPSQQVFLLQPNEINLERRLPIQHIQSNVSGHEYDDHIRHDENQIQMRNIPHYDINSNPSSSTSLDIDNHDEIDRVQFKRENTNIKTNLYNAVLPQQNIYESQGVKVLGMNEIKRSAGQAFFDRHNYETNMRL